MRPALLALTLIAIAAPAAAQRWGYPGADRYAWDRARSVDRGRGQEGKVEVSRFLAEGVAAQALGHGAITVAPEADRLADDRERATYEAAVIDQLAGAGYDTASNGDGGQVIELTIRSDEIVPAEAKRKPVHGAMSVGVSSRGGSYESLAIGVDLRKPAKALLSTRLAARIRDKASGVVLWEGRADIATRDGDPEWSDQAIATRLAKALFAGFPGKNGETIRG